MTIIACNFIFILLVFSFFRFQLALLLFIPTLLLGIIILKLIPKFLTFFNFALSSEALLMAARAQQKKSLPVEHPIDLARLTEALE